jgi:hypothetical protein
MYYTLLPEPQVPPSCKFFLVIYAFEFTLLLNFLHYIPQLKEVKRRRGGGGGGRGRGTR